jgi:excisionase family DNA binding protein
MPRTRKRPEADRRPPPPPANGVQALAEVLTLADAAAYLRLSEADVRRLVQEQDLPARQLGTEWRFLKAAIDDWLRTGPGPRANKEAWMALAGAWKGDPLVEEELKGIYRRRGRPMAEDE